MDALIVMLRNVLLFVALAVPGYILVKTKILKIADTAVFSNVMLYLATPFLVIYSVMDMPLGKSELIQVGVAVAVGLVYTFLAFFLSGFFKKEENGDVKKHGMQRFCSIFPNNGFLGIPLALAVFGAGSPVMLSLIVINVLNNTAIFTLGAYLVSGDKKSVNLKKVLLNPILIGLLVGVFLNLCDISERVPESKTYAGHFNNLVTPLAMLVLGMKLAETKVLALFTDKKGYFVSLFKLIVFPVIGVSLLFGARYLFSSVVGVNLLFAAFIAFATPTASLCSALADKYGGDGDGAARYTLLTTLLSVVTLPVLYGILSVII